MAKMIRRAVWRLLKPVFFLFDAEKIHQLTCFFLKMVHQIGGGSAIRCISGTQAAKKPANLSAMGLSMSSRVGLAAGFDKNADLLELWPHFGFGFAEIGTVTPRPQPGNARPRLFRNPAVLALFNRMGFNSDGAEAVAARVSQARNRLPEGFRVGVNIGKNADTALEDAHLDYAKAARPFRDLADYLVVNVSSPNTTGLRSLQNVDSLCRIFDSVRAEITGFGKNTPVFLKLAPEMGESELEPLLQVENRLGLGGWILTNTRAGEFHGLNGGWSGEPLREISRIRLQWLRPRTRLPIISVGGIMDVGEARLRVELGADLIQIYSGWVYGGPHFPGEISDFLRKFEG